MKLFAAHIEGAGTMVVDYDDAYGKEQANAYSFNAIAPLVGVQNVYALNDKCGIIIDYQEWLHARSFKAFLQSHAKDIIAEHGDNLQVGHMSAFLFNHNLLRDSELQPVYFYDDKGVYNSKTEQLQYILHSNDTNSMMFMKGVLVATLNVYGQIASNAEHLKDAQSPTELLRECVHQITTQFNYHTADAHLTPMCALLIPARPEELAQLDVFDDLVTEDLETDEVKETINPQMELFDEFGKKAA